VIDAFQECEAEANTTIIAEGEEGDFLYFIESGTVSCFKHDNYLCTVHDGSYFGELALLYTCPRAATVRTDTYCKLWKLDQESFNHLVKIGMMEQRNMRETFLQGVEILCQLDTFERSNIVDALCVHYVAQGTEILCEGDPDNVDTFYILEEGQCEAYKGGESVAQYQSGDYFGELALLMSTPRQCTVVVTSPQAKLLSLERKTFDRMVGSLRERMIERAARKYRGWGDNPSTSNLQSYHQDNHYIGHGHQ